MNTAFLRICAGIALLIFIAYGTGAAEFTLEQHEIEITLSKESTASVNEKFSLSFPNSFLQDRFDKSTQKIGTDLAKWAELDPRFKIYISGTIIPQSANLSREFVPGEERGKIIITYMLQEHAAMLLKEESRYADYSLNNTLFKEFIVSGNTYSIPAST